MRVLHVLDHSLPLHSGYTFRTAAILRAQHERGWQTLQLTTPRHALAAGPAGADPEAAEGLAFHRTPLPAPSWLTAIPGAGPYLAEMRATARRLAELAAQWKPDVLHAHSPVLTALPALWVGSRLGLPVVYEVRALWEDGAVDHGTTRQGSLRYRLTRAVETFALKRADHVTTICNGLRDDIALRGIAAERITVIPNAVDPQAFHYDPPADAALREQHGLQGKTVIGFIGSFYGYEGLELLIEAFARLAAARPELRLLFAGGGLRDAAMKDAAQRLGIADRVLFLGRVPHAEVQRVYSVVDLLAYPRLPMRLTEMVTPLKPLEAMAMGRLLIASDVGGHRELIRDGQTGYLFSAGSVDALAARLAAALDDRRQWDAIRAAGRRFVEHERTWAGSVAQYDAVYRRLADRGGAALPRIA